MKISDLMTAVSAGVAPDASMASAIRLMQEKSCSCVVVSENGYPKGIITERDVVRFFVEGLDEALDTQIPIHKVMTKRPICVHELTSLKDALSIAHKRYLRHLIVTDSDGKLLGLVTQTDMVNAYLQLVEREAELETENQALQLLSTEDPLMGIGNRRAMEIDLQFTEDSAKRYDKDYALALIDVDRFKKYNDYYGHQKGDEVLKQLADIINASKRVADRVYRYGGEEILLLMPETVKDDALIAAERIRQAVEAAAIEHQQSPFGKLTISIGVAAAEDESWKELLHQSDQALYKAKESGRNRVCVWP